jgi:hypothetical protein
MIGALGQQEKKAYDYVYFSGADRDPPRAAALRIECA